MLLPALNKARAAARSASCTNNLKQLGTGFLQYMNDNEDFIPVGVPNGTSDSCNWQYCLWSSYVNSDNSFHCPAGPNPKHATNKAFVSYSGNMAMTVNTGGTQWSPDWLTKPHSQRKVLTVNNTADTILLWEIQGTAWNTVASGIDGVYGGWGSSSHSFNLCGKPDNGAEKGLLKPSSTQSGPPHNNNMRNYLWVDGHVSAMNSFDEKQWKGNKDSSSSKPE